MIPRQWLVSCHRKRPSAEAHRSVPNPRAMPPMLPWRRPHLSRPEAAATAAATTGAGSEAIGSLPSVVWAANGASRWPLVAACATARRSNGVATHGQKSAAAAPRTAGHATPQNQGFCP